MIEETSFKNRLDDLRRVIGEKKEMPSVGSKATLDWKQAELLILDQIADETITDPLLTLQQQCVKSKIPCFYSFFLMQKVIRIPSAVSEVAAETTAVREGKSKYHTIKSFIKMREHLLGKVNQYSGNNTKGLFEDIDDIRFLNLEIVRSVEGWKSSWRATDGSTEPVFHEGGSNYLLKISNDNADMINLANFKKTKFVSPPNPFFLSEDGNLQGMSQQQKQDIANCLDTLSKERQLDLRMSVEGGLFLARPRLQKMTKTVKPAVQMEKSMVRDAKNEIQTVKEDEIRKIYKINKSISEAKLSSKRQKQAGNIRRMSHQQKQAQRLTMYKPQKALSRKSSDRPKPQTRKPESSLIQKINTLAELPKKQESKAKTKIRQEVQKQLSGSEGMQEKSSPVKQVREIKPKIKLIQEKESIVEDTVKSVLDLAVSMMSTSRPVSRRNSTFYKKIQPIIEETDENPNDLKPITQLNRKQSLTQSNFALKKTVSKDLKQPIKEQKDKRQQSPVKQIKERKEIKELKEFREMKLPKSLQPKKKKELSAHSIDIEQSKLSLEKRNANQQSRALTSQLKNLTIINIYKSKQRGSKRDPSQSAINPIQPNYSSFITELPREEGIDSSQYSVAYEKMKGKSEIQIEKLSKQLEKRSHKGKKKEELLQETEKKRKNAEEQLEKKNALIAELEAKVKAIESKKQSGTKIKNERVQSHQREFERQKKKREIQARILKDNVKTEEQRLAANRQKELHLRDVELKQEYKRNIKQLQQESIQKRRQYEQILHQEERKAKQTQAKIAEQQRRAKEIEAELAQKKMKQRLLRKIVQQKGKEQEHIEEYNQNTEQLLKIQLEERQKMQREALQLIEIQKERINKIYRQLQQKNKRMQEQNEKKAEQLREIDRKKKQALQSLKQVEEQFQKSMVKVKQQREEKKVEEEHDMESLKLKIKEELLAEILKKKEEEEREEKEEEERRARRLKRIQQQVAQALREEQEQLQKENLQFLQRLQAMKEKANIPIAINKDTIGELQADHKPDDSINSPAKKQQGKRSKVSESGSKSKVKSLDKSKNRSLDKSQQKSLDKSKDKSKDKEKMKDNSMDKSSASLKKSKISAISSPKMAVTNKKEQITEPINHPQAKVQKQQTPSQVDPLFSLTPALQTAEKYEKVEPSDRISSPINSPKKKEQTKQPNIIEDQRPGIAQKKETKQMKAEISKKQAQDLQQKYKKLTEMTKKMKQQTILDVNITSFMETFLTSLDKNMREMLPWTKAQLQKIFHTRRVDIFQGSIGWLEDGKYNLIGGVECLQAVGSKYGAVQIHQIFIFDKNNPYQKQYLAKRIKIFEQIGFVFQKKLPNSALFSIRFVVKLPEEAVGPAKQFGVSVVTTLHLEGHKSVEQNYKKTTGLGYLFGRCIKNNMEKGEIEEYLKIGTHFQRAIQAQIDKGVEQNSRYLRIEEVNDTLFQLNATLPLRYYRSPERAFYLISCDEYQMEETLSYSGALQEGLSLVIMQIQNNELPLDFVVMDLLDKISKEGKKRQIDVCLPIWQYSVSGQLLDGKLSYTHKDKLTAELNLTSICSSFLIKHPHIDIKPPFLIALCKNDTNSMPIRSLHAHIVTKNQLIHHNLK